MKILLKAICLTLLLSVSLSAKADLQQHQIYSPAIADNFIGTNATRTISVYLPKDYEKNNKAYPVLYFLGAYNWGANFANSFEKIFSDYEQTKEPLKFIVVMIDGDTPLRGSFYVNSKAHGRFADFVTKEAVQWVNNKYRTKTDSKHTAIAGFSMGGTGALRFAADNPAQFGHVFALSPGLIDENGLSTSYLGNAKAIAHYERFRSALAKTTSPRALMKEEFKSFQGMALWQNGEDNSNAAFVMAYGGAFAGHNGEPFGAHFSQVKSQTHKWRFGFGELINQYSDSKVLSKLHSVRVEVGKHDEYKWIADGSLKLKALSEAQKTKVNVIVFDGDHSSKVRERIAQSMLPHFQSLL